MPVTKPSNRELFAQLYNEFMPRVYRYIFYKMNDRQTAEDLTSIVFEKALVKIGSYSSDRAAFSTWIFSIARNTVIDHYRTGTRRQSLPLEEAVEMPSDEESPEEDAENKAEKECLMKSLARLPAGDQEIIRLKFAAELTNRQIAATLGLSESNVGVKLFRAIKRLREDFEEAWNG